jgi:hypothetical protein
LFFYKVAEVDRSAQRYWHFVSKSENGHSERSEGFAFDFRWGAKSRFFAALRMTVERIGAVGEFTRRRFFTVIYCGFANRAATTSVVAARATSHINRKKPQVLSGCPENTPHDFRKNLRFYQVAQTARDLLQVFTGCGGIGPTTSVLAGWRQGPRVFPVAAQPRSLCLVP